MKFLSIISLALSLCLVAAAPSSAQNAAFKCATVDANTLIKKYHRADTKLAKLVADRDAYAKEREQQMVTIKETEAKVNACIAKIRSKETTAEEQKNLAQEYDDLVSQHRALTKDIQEQDREKITAIKSKLATETRILLDEITKVTNAYAKEKGYTWVIETSGVSNTQISP
ncbi:MAG: OmpH family outer membrane protein, partial [Akkermansiaceae bacterium]